MISSCDVLSMVLPKSSKPGFQSDFRWAVRTIRWSHKWSPFLVVQSWHGILCYRDRAQERRKGYHPDYEQVGASTQSIADNLANAGLSIEESKFLGGDVDHTHLVKGLDYALLQKVAHFLSKENVCTVNDFQAYTGMVAPMTHMIHV